ncbi:hypothetical protein MJT46_014364 [Ovis ammon polii x Ovis aries]|nr:hypothetical protein MJT46_014364 [Ovis ammon polii x Ovis aries]
MPAFETRTDSPGGLQRYPKIHVSTGEESSRSGPDSTQGLRPRHRRERNPERPPRKSHGDWPFLRPPERVPEVPIAKNSRRSRRISRGGILHRKGERNSRVVPPFQESRRCVSPFQRNFFPCTALTFKPRIDSHNVCTWDSPVRKPRGKASWKYPKIHVSTGEESSGSGPDSTQGLRPRHRRESNPERPPRNSPGDWPFLRPAERLPEVPVPRIDSHQVCTWDSPVRKPRGKASWAKNSRRSRRISRGGAVHRKGERNSRVVPPFQESRRCVSPFQRNRFSLHCLDVQAEDRLPPGVHVGQPCAKASWESLMGKTRGKTIDPLLHAADCVTLLLPLWRKAQVHARIRDED